MPRTQRQLDGAQAEAHAADFLAGQGLAIVARNFRSRMGEIDLIARDGETLVFVEVRRRADSTRFGGARGSVDGAKQRRLAAAARFYLSRLATEPPCRFDVVAIQGEDCAWLRDAFAVS